jgi:hypothetical protein
LYVVLPLEYVNWMVPVAETPSPVLVALTVIAPGPEAKFSVPEPNAPEAPSPNADELAIPPPTAAAKMPSSKRNQRITHLRPTESTPDCPHTGVAACTGLTDGP